MATWWHYNQFFLKLWPTFYQISQKSELLCWIFCWQMKLLLYCCTPWSKEKNPNHNPHMPANTCLSHSSWLGGAWGGARLVGVHSHTVKALWTSLGWARMFKSILTALSLFLCGIRLGWELPAEAAKLGGRGDSGQRLVSGSSCQSEQDKRAAGFRRIKKKTSLSSLEWCYMRYRFDKWMKRTSCETVHHQASASSFQLLNGDEEQNKILK